MSNLPTALQSARARAALAQLTAVDTDPGSSGETPPSLLGHTPGIASCNSPDPSRGAEDGTGDSRVDEDNDDDRGFGSVRAVTLASQQCPAAEPRPRTFIGLPLTREIQESEIESEGTEPWPPRREMSPATGAGPVTKRLTALCWRDDGLAQPAPGPAGGKLSSAGAVETAFLDPPSILGCGKLEETADNEAAAAAPPKLAYVGSSLALASQFESAAAQAARDAMASHLDAVGPFRAPDTGAESAGENAAGVQPAFEALIRPKTAPVAATLIQASSDRSAASTVRAVAEDRIGTAAAQMRLRMQPNAESTDRDPNLRQDSPHGSSDSDAEAISEWGRASAMKPVLANHGSDLGAAQEIAAGSECLASAGGEPPLASISRDADCEPAEPVAMPLLHVMDPDNAENAAPLRAVSLTVEDARGASVNLKFTERRGEIHVVTRSTDDNLSKDMARGLPELKQQLEDAALSAELWAGPTDKPQMDDTGWTEIQTRTGEGGDSGRHTGGDSQQQPRPGGTIFQWMDVIEDSLDEGSNGGTR